MFKIVPAAVLMTALAILPASARPPTFEERQRIEAALRTAGYTSWAEIELYDEEDWRVESARSSGARQACDVYVDAETYEISEEDCDQ